MPNTTLTADQVRRAIEAVSVPGDSTNDRAEADRVTNAVRPLTKPELFALLSVAGLEGIRPHDAKGYILARLHNRLTARIRAHERAEV